MTLIMALVWGLGVVVTADTRATAGPIYGEERKIYPIYLNIGDEELDLAVVAGAGDSALIKQGVQLMRRVYIEWSKELGNEVRNPTEDESLRIVERIERALIERYALLRNVGINPSVEILLATVTHEGKPLLYVFDSRGIANPMHEVPGYAILGAGRITGAQLLLSLLGYDPERAASWDHSVFPVFVIDMVSQVDPTVSSFTDPQSSVYIRYDVKARKVVMGPMKIESFKEAKEAVGKRVKAIRKLWELMEIASEDEVLGYLEELMKKYTKRVR